MGMIASSRVPSLTLQINPDHFSYIQSQPLFS